MSLEYNLTYNIFIYIKSLTHLHPNGVQIVQISYPSFKFWIAFETRKISFESFNQNSIFVLKRTYTKCLPD